MAEQILKVRLVADTGNATTALKLFTENTKSAGAAIKDTFTSVDVETNKIAYDIEVTASKINSLKQAFTDAKKAIVSKESGATLSARYIEETKNIRAAEAVIEQIRLANEKELSDRLTQINKDRLAFEFEQDREANKIRMAAKKADTIAAYTELAEIEKRQIESMRSLVEFEAIAARQADKVRIEAKRKDTIAAFEELAAKEKEQADLVKFHLQANYNSRKVMYADLMRQMDEADAARAAKEKERAARAPQAGRDDRGYQPFASGFVGDKRQTEATATANRQQTLQEAEARAFLTRRARAEKAWADSFDKATTPALNRNSKAVEENEKKHKSLATHIAEVIGIYRIYNAAINLTERALLSVPKALIELQTTTATLTATFGSFAGATRELAFLNEEAARTGIAVTTLRESYAQASASFIMAGESAATTRDIFRDINTVATTLHLNADRVSSVFLALSQMFNKGKVQAEELTKQLSQTLPGITNQTAKALGLSAAALGESMKKGLISAHEAVRLMSKQIAETFGGEAFNKATDGLNASLGRLSTAWTLFAESMGKATESTMKAFIDGATSTINALTKLTSHTEQTTTAFNILLGVLSGTLVYAAIAGLEKLAVAMATFTFSLPVVGQIAAVGAGVAALGTYFYVSGKQAEDAAKSYRKALDAEKLRQTGGIAPLDTIKLQRPEDNQAYKDALEIQRGANRAFKEAIKGEGVPMAEVAKLKEDLRLANDLVARTYKEALQEPVETIKKETTNASVEIAKAHEMYLTATGKEVEARRLAFMRNNAEQIETLKKAISEGNQEAVTALMDVYGSYQAIQEKDTKKPKKPIDTETYKASLESIKTIFTELQSSISEALGNIDTLYQSNLLSIKDYFTQKRQLIQTDTAVEKEGIEARLQLAFAQKDRVAIEKLQGELIKARTEETKKLTQATQEQTEAERAYKALTLEGQAKVLGYQGRGGEAAIAEFDIQTRSKFEKFARENDIAALRNLEIERQNIGLKGAVADADERRAMQEAEYQNSVERTNILLNTGAIGQLSALREIEAANEARITSMQEAITLKEQEIAKTEELVGVVDFKERNALKRLREDLEKFKLTSDVVAQHFEKVFSDSFTNAFTGFTNGTMTAKQAFSSLITSMIGEIQKLIAQEMASAALRTVIRPLANWAMGGLGGLFGGAVSGATAATMGTGPLQMAANGGVFSGPGISAYSGSVVTSPTIFPFARGTGLMGEAGPEAILPLKRNAQGKLGVTAENAGQSGSNVYNIAVTVQSSRDEKPADTGQKIAEAMMRTIAKQEISSAARAGNSLNRTTKFG